MRTSAQQDKAFLQAVISSTLLEEAISWISNNLSPDDVFSEQDLIDWALNNGFVEKLTE